MKIYTYKKCGTCVKALKYLDSKGLRYTEVPIRDTPPTEDELRQMLTAYNGEIKRLFNVSGQDYRALNMKDRLPTMSDDEAITLLHSNGNLVKRPFLLADNVALVGFKESEWESL